MRDVIAQVNAAGHGDWRRQVERVGGCAHPLHFRPRVTAASRREPIGALTRVVLGRCQNRRARVCASCARLYQGDMYQLVVAGLNGGKGVPGSVAEHPRVFVTLTAPTFGAVHSFYGDEWDSVAESAAGGRDGPVGWRSGHAVGSRPCHARRSGPCAHGRPTACWRRHGEDDPMVGAPLCRDCYDYAGAVIWQASVGVLWSRLRTYLPRHLATHGGRSRADVHRTVRLSFVKIVEYQRRGLVHVHAIIRADGPAQESSDGTGAGPRAAPSWVSAALIGQAVESAARAVRVRVDAGAAGSWTLGWGPQMRWAPITSARQSAGGEGRHPGQVAAYIAKYATKSTEATGWERAALSGASPAQSPGRAGGLRAAHAAAMVDTAHDLAEIPELAGLRLSSRASDLGYRGRVASTSRSYSTTLTALRQARVDHYARSSPKEPGPNGAAGEPDGAPGWSWRLVGHGYTPGQVVLAADIARDIHVNADAAREADRETRVQAWRDEARRVGRRDGGGAGVGVSEGE